MTIYLDGHTLKYEIESLGRIFYPGQGVRVVQGAPGQPPYLHTRLEATEQNLCLMVELCNGGQPLRVQAQIPLRSKKQTIEMGFSCMVYALLTQATGHHPPWGMLTGIRPVKLLRESAQQGGLERAMAQMANRWQVTPKKLILAAQTLLQENKVLALSRPESFSLYISIPFCPSRCRYCSFVSSSVKSYGYLIPQYLDLLCEEMTHTAAIAARLGLRLETVYIGGGTPSTLSAEQLARLLEHVKTSFDIRHLRELTVEAGRPDTITPEKLAALHAGGCGRVSINPQTLNPRVLEAIGRNHSPELFFEAYEMAAKVGFNAINVDLIAGLPQDDIASFAGTMRQILQLKPENITLHTLSIKRGTDINLDGYHHTQYNAVEAMVDNGYAAMNAAGYHPYYLYRQKNIAANLENTGFCRGDTPCLYNVFIMDETHSVFGVGAGAVTKLRQPGGSKIERIFNYKYPYEYTNGLAELLQRKQAIHTFYTKGVLQDG